MTQCPVGLIVFGNGSNELELDWLPQVAGPGLPNRDFHAEKAFLIGRRLHFRSEGSELDARTRDLIRFDALVRVQQVAPPGFARTGPRETGIAQHAPTHVRPGGVRISAVGHDLRPVRAPDASVQVALDRTQTAA